ncbi:site-2 protease family protein [Acidicapsa ligni]|uniref:site-2 protease family protein n=1 Tax=Acidicapsa ligni TaxID=542300 RepID=UPI0021DFBEAB|nr:site-2 protease family protein [Acidicapsa ligni]
MTLRKHLGHPLREYALPLLLLCISIVTTTAIGARFMQNFVNNQPSVVTETDLWPWPWLLQHPANFRLGWSFSLTLLFILLTHEFGHYIACRVHGIRATLPWVLPAPTLSGTAGAVIQIRSRIPGRRALMDVGVYGPLGGYVASLIVIAIGFCLSHPAPRDATPALIQFGRPLTLDWVYWLLNRIAPHLVPVGNSFLHITRHPVLIAGWIGLFITSLNLIPGGQLDGGHILYAISPRLHRISTLLLPPVLIICGVFFWIGWIAWGLILLIPAMRHPRVEAEPTLNRGRKALGLIALLLFALTFSLTPFADSSLLYYLH